MNRAFIHRALLLCVVLLGSLSLFAQTKELRLQVVVKDDSTKKMLDGVQVMIYQNGNEYNTYDAGNSGKVKFNLELGTFVYDIKLTRAGFVQKILRFDTRNIPLEDQEGGFEATIDIALFRYIEGFNLDLVKDPMGINKFDPEANDMLWDGPYTKAKQDEIKKELERLKKVSANKDESKKQFDQLMMEGDQKMAEKKWQEAMGKFDGALKIYATDPTAKAKYAEAKAKYDAELAAAAESAAYDKLIKEGDDAMTAKNYEAAKKAYTDASKKKPTEKYPKERLFEITELMKNKEKQAQYDALISEADAKYKAKDYQNAISKYRDAQSVLPTVAYPKEQIAKAQAEYEAMLAAAKEDAVREEKYNEQMALGDKNVREKKYDAALQNYQEAKRLKPSEKLPPSKILEVEGLIADLQKQQKADEERAATAALDAQYQALIQAADNLFVANDLEGAKSKYTEALGVKSGEKYPQNRISEIDALIAENARKEEEERNNALANEKQNQIDAEYQRRIQAADAAFIAENWDEARSGYNGALEIKESEKYPRARLELIEQRIAQAQADTEAAALAAKQAEADRERALREAELEAERLKAEEERLAEEKRRQEEEAERLRLEAEAREAERLAAEARRKLKNNVDKNKEDEVERYYREAKELEDRLKYDNLKRKTETAETMMAEVDARSVEALKAAQSKAQGQSDFLGQMQSAGSSRKIAATAEILRKKDQAAANNTTYAERADGRLTASILKAEQDKKKNAKSEKNASAERNAEEMKQKQDYYNENTKMYASRGNTSRAGAAKEVERKKETVAKSKFTGEEIRSENSQVVEQKKESNSALQSDNQAAAKERRSLNEGYVEEDKKELESIGIDKAPLREAKTAEIEESKEKRAINEFRRKSKAEQQTYDRRKQVFSKDPGTEKSPDDYKPVPGTEKLQEGVTERSYELGNKNITERTVKMGNKVDVYRKCVSKYGIAYFKNGRSITKQRWVQETMTSGD